MNQVEMLEGGKKKFYFNMCTCVCEWVAGVSWRIHLLGKQKKEHVFGILAGFMEAPVPFSIL